MKENSNKSAVLLLEDGTAFYGKASGKTGTTVGELCFNTGMTGYQEIFTDPSYTGQILVSTNAHIGNYGIKDSDSESEGIKISGFICKNYNVDYSRPLGDKTIQTYFEEEGLVSISDVDTRAIVRHIRSKGAMNAIISSEELNIEELKKKLAKVPSMAGLELSSTVSTKESYFIGSKDAKFKIAVLDVGVKKNILKCFADRDCYLKVFPAKTSLKEMESFEADGYFISNGPGDPSSMDYAVATIKDIMAVKKPMFGICLGHQLIALSLGMETYKMHNGHRGINHPVKNLKTGLCEITSQNHGFGVSSESVAAAKDLIDITHVNLNDDTIEGISTKDGLVSSVQYHPESSPGPHDSRYLFDNFLDIVASNK